MREQGFAPVTVNAPQVISPLTLLFSVVGSKEIPIALELIIPWAKRLSVTVGTGVLEAGDRVPIVRSTGPILPIKTLRSEITEA